ncbi:MAG: hypothetical protein P1V97_00870 [Planctomycetota bacterium]|nr:hypothetical protein [Planctomycetota bacterium]
MTRLEQFTKTELLKKIAALQNGSSSAVAKGNLTEAHKLLKSSAILIFENSGPKKVWPLSFSIPLFLTLFRAGYYLENDDQDYLYRYEAIPGQLANACHFQLGLSKRDGSGYHPPWKAKKECAAAAQYLIRAHGRSVIVQSIEERALRCGREYQCHDLIFDCDLMGYPRIRVKQGLAPTIVQFTKARFFHWNSFATAAGKSEFTFEDALDCIERSMVTEYPGN